MKVVLEEILFELRKIRKELHEINSKEFTVDANEIAKSTSSHSQQLLRTNHR